jgi:hypothetical protein
MATSSSRLFGSPVLDAALEEAELLEQEAKPSAT